MAAKIALTCIKYGSAEHFLFHLSFIVYHLACFARVKKVGMKTYKLKINGHDYEVVVNKVDNQVANVTVNGVEYDVALNVESKVTDRVDAVSVAVASEKTRDVTDNTQNAGNTPNADNTSEAVKTPSTGNVGGGATFNVTSPLPGVILDICVKEGDMVKEGQKVVVLEAMKMENAILAEKAGVVKKIHVSQGESVLEEAALVTIG